MRISWQDVRRDFYLVGRVHLSVSVLYFMVSKYYCYSSGQIKTFLFEVSGLSLWVPVPFIRVIPGIPALVPCRLTLEAIATVLEKEINPAKVGKIVLKRKKN